MKNFINGFVLGLACLISACTSPSQSWDKEGVKQEVNEMLEHYFRDIKASGLTAEFAYLDSTADFFWVPPGYGAALDYDSVRNILEANAPNLSSVAFTWEKLDIHPLSENIAAYTGQISGIIVDKAGLESRVNMLETGTAIRRGGSWKILCGQSRDFPGVQSIP